MRVDGSDDFVWLNAKTAYFYLLIYTAQKSDLSIGQISNQIARPEKPICRVDREWIRHEPFCI